MTPLRRVKKNAGKINTHAILKEQLRSFIVQMKQLYLHGMIFLYLFLGLFSGF